MSVDDFIKPSRKDRKPKKKWKKKPLKQDKA